ncbi:MAG: UPF0179 family protein [Candidatus Hydrothermarchaeales archaeon]
MKKIITLIDTERAKPGYQFIHYGVAEECEDCDFKIVCIDNLEEGRRYEITGLKDLEHECNIYGKVKVVEVRESDLLAAINPKYAFIGSSIHFTPIECDDVFCENFGYCTPEGLKEGDKCEILDALNTIKCGRGHELQAVRVRRVAE